MAERASTGEHLRDLGGDVAELVRDESARARQELGSKLRAAAPALGAAFGAGALGLASVVAGTEAAIDLLHEGPSPAGSSRLPRWSAAAAVTTVTAAGAAALLLWAAGNLRRRGMLPEATLANVEAAARAAADRADEGQPAG